MENKDWTIIQSLYKEKSITQAAEKLYISQPALTYRIKQIEKEFGSKMIIRGKKGIEFTSHGDYLVEYSKKMIMQLQELKDSLQNINHQVQGVLRIGVSSNFARYILPDLLRDFNNNFNKVEFNVKTGISSEVIHLLQKEEVHVGILRGDINWRDSKHLLSKEPLCIVSTSPITLKDLPKKRRINYKTDIHLKNTIDNWWQSQFKQPPLVSMEVDRIETCKEMVRNGLGYGIFPWISLKDEKEFYTYKLRDNNNEIILRQTWLFYRNTSMELSVVQAFVNFLKNLEL